MDQRSSEGVASMVEILLAGILESRQSAKKA